MTSPTSRGKRWRFAIGVAGLAGTEPLAAQILAPPPLPPIDLGQTNILDGEGGPGALLELIASGSGADRLADRDGDAVPGRNRQRIASFVVHPILVAQSTVAGAHPGVEVLVPVSRVDNDFLAGGSGRRAGFGDVTIAPFLQWSSSDPGPGTVSARVALQVVAPTGDRAAGRAVNTGQGGWQVSPYLVMTWRVSARWEVSGRAIYDWSGATVAQDVTGVRVRDRPGDLAALNLSASFASSDSWRFGIGGYALLQLGSSRTAGTVLAGSRQRIYALGPVARWHSGKVTLLPAAFVEFGAHDRPQGVSANLRLQRSF